MGYKKLSTFSIFSICLLFFALLIPSFILSYLQGKVLFFYQYPKDYFIYLILVYGVFYVAFGYVNDMFPFLRRGQEKRTSEMTFEKFIFMWACFTLVPSFLSRFPSVRLTFSFYYLLWLVFVLSMIIKIVKFPEKKQKTPPAGYGLITFLAYTCVTVFLFAGLCLPVGFIGYGTKAGIYAPIIFISFCVLFCMTCFYVGGVLEKKEAKFALRMVSFLLASYFSYKTFLSIFYV